MDSAATASERRGQVLEVIRELLRDGQLDQALAVITQLVARNTELERRLAEVLTRTRKNEGVSSAQLLLLLDGLTSASDEALKASDEALRTASGIDDKRKEEVAEEPKAAPRVKKPLPANLRRVENPIPVPTEERPCPKCGAERKCIGHDVTEVVQLIPAEVVVRVDKREKLACEACEGELVRAPVGDKTVPGGIMDTSVASRVVTDKYDHGLPLHRQKERFGHLGFPVAVSTLADQVTWGTDLLRPIWHAAFEEVVAALIMHLDGTGLAVRDRDSPKGIKLGTLWGYVGGEGNHWTALYLYASTGKKTGQRPGELGPEDVLKLRSGFTVADAATLFDKSFQRRDLVECGCNMHARRYFSKAIDSGDARAALPLAAFKKLYEIEDEIRDRDAPTRCAARQLRSKPVYDELILWAKTHQPHEPPSSPMGRAITYLLNNQAALTRFLEHGEIPADNGIVERLHVRAALTRKNYLFAGSDAGAERAAIAYTVLGSCRLAGVDPIAYLNDVLPRLTRRIRIKDMPALLPARWKAARAQVAVL